jgi:hypothetical protein
VLEAIDMWIAKQRSTKNLTGVMRKVIGHA